MGFLAKLARKVIKTGARIVEKTIDVVEKTIDVVEDTIEAVVEMGVTNKEERLQKDEDERLAAEQEQERLAAEQEQERLAAEQEQERLAAEEEQERLAAEQEQEIVAAAEKQQAELKVAQDKKSDERTSQVINQLATQKVIENQAAFKLSVTNEEQDKTGRLATLDNLATVQKGPEDNQGTTVIQQGGQTNENNALTELAAQQILDKLATFQQGQKVTKGKLFLNLKVQNPDLRDEVQDISNTPQSISTQQYPKEINVQEIDPQPTSPTDKINAITDNASRILDSSGDNIPVQPSYIIIILIGVSALIVAAVGLYFSYNLFKRRRNIGSVPKNSTKPSKDKDKKHIGSVPKKSLKWSQDVIPEIHQKHDTYESMNQPDYSVLYDPYWEFNENQNVKEDDHIESDNVVYTDNNSKPYTVSELFQAVRMNSISSSDPNCLSGDWEVDVEKQSIWSSNNSIPPVYNLLWKQN
jgi:chemotaxis protein histidine kinase CheA